MIVAGFATFGIVTLVGIGWTAAAVGTVSAVGIGTGAGPSAVTHIMASKFIKAEKKFKEFTQQFEDLCRYAIKVHSFTENVSTSLKRTQTFIKEIQLYDYDSMICQGVEMNYCVYIKWQLIYIHQRPIAM